MNDQKKIVWLASYPKSGNTWFRAYLSALLNHEGHTVDINHMYSSSIASSRQLFDELTGISSADLTSDEIEMLRPQVYRQNALRSEHTLYYKVHDGWIRLPDSEPLFPAGVTKAVLYIIRNPLDVAISFSHHLNISVDETITQMNNPDYTFCSRKDRIFNQLPQKLLTWSEHVLSWTVLSQLPVLVIRYEDMLNNPIATFEQATGFIGLKSGRNDIMQALEQVTFERLKQQELQNGFAEKSARAESFFRKGIAGEWKTILSEEQVRKITALHGRVMKTYGYTPD